MQIFINHQFVSDQFPVILSNDRGFLLGDGLFETIKCVNNYLLFFEQHYARLKKSAQQLAIPFLYQELELLEICQKLLFLNNLHDNIAALRITLTRGPATRGITLSHECNPTLLITAVLYQDNFTYPKALITTIKRNEFSELTRLKTIQYLEPILAKQIAQQQGYDEGIMLNTAEAITETSTANLFFVYDGTVLTPRLEDGVLPGIMRAVVLQCCQEHNIPIEESQIFPEQALLADEIFQTNSLLEIQALSAINHHQLNPQHYKTMYKIKSIFEKIKLESFEKKYL